MWMEKESFGNIPLNQILQKKLEHIQQIQRLDLQGARAHIISFKRNYSPK